MHMHFASSAVILNFLSWTMKQADVRTWGRARVMWCKYYLLLQLSRASHWGWVVRLRSDMRAGSWYKHLQLQSQASIQVMWSLSTNQRPEISWGHHLVLAHSGGRHGAINWRNSVFFIGKQYLIRRALCFHLSEDPSFARDLWGSNDRGATRLVRRRHKSWNENLRMCIILQIMRKLHHKIIINTTLLTRCIRRQAPYSMKLKRSV